MRVVPAFFTDAEGTALDYAWRYAPGDGDGEGREKPEFDDRQWISVLPSLDPKTSPEWQGAGWFRRHLIVDPGLRDRTIALRLQCPGVAQVFLDGQLLISQTAVMPEIPAARSESCLLSLTPGHHVLAVHYAYPNVFGRAKSIGFHLTLADPYATPQSVPTTLEISIRSALVAIPLFLVFLHLALYFFDRHGREHLFYAVEMLAFAFLVLHDSRGLLVPDYRSISERLINGVAIIAILFSLLTYYALRTERIPRMWRLLVAIGAVCFIASYIISGPWTQYLWMAFFVLVNAEIIRVERTVRTVSHRGTPFVLASFALVFFAISLQILINFRIIQPIGGVHDVYVFGIIASAVGMSLYLARTMGDRRITSLENERKTYELTRARNLQLSMLPRELPKIAGLEVAASTIPAAEVGGDYYDVRETGDGALLFAFGDATGHGLAAGIVVTAAKALFTSLPSDGSLNDRLLTCDRTMRAMQLPDLRMCLSLATISNHSIAIASAAMPPILIHRAATGAIDELGAGGLPLGSRLQSDYPEQRAPLAAGDTILFATDGFAEQPASDGRQFGYANVAAAFAKAVDAGSADAIIERLTAAAAQYRGACAQEDDLTFVVVRVGAR